MLKENKLSLKDGQGVLEKRCCWFNLPSLCGKWGEAARQVIEFVPFFQRVVHFISGGASWLNEHSASSRGDWSV